MDLPFKDIMRKITQLRNERKDKYVVRSECIIASLHIYIYTFCHLLCRNENGYVL